MGKIKNNRAPANSPTRPHLNRLQTALAANEHQPLFILNILMGDFNQKEHLKKSTRNFSKIGSSNSGIRNPYF